MNIQDTEIVNEIYDRGWTSTRTVERNTRFGRKAVGKRLRSLEERDILECRKGTGRHGADEYRVTISAVPEIMAKKIT